MDKAALIEGVDYEKVKGGYRLLRQIHIRTPYRAASFHGKFISIYRDGWLILRPGYFWNGSNVVIDCLEDMRASAFHDAVYTLIIIGALKNSWTNRRRGDVIYYDLMRADGMGYFRANGRYIGLRAFGWSALLKTQKQAA